MIPNIRVTRRVLERFGDDLFLATEQADDPLLARLAAFLALEGTDGYNEIRYECAWGAQGSPDWVMGVKQRIRDFTPAFVLKVCKKGDYRRLTLSAMPQSDAAQGSSHPSLSPDNDRLWDSCPRILSSPC